MYLTKTNLITLFSILFLSSCVSIRSTVRPGYSVDLKKIYLVTYCGISGSKSFMVGLGENIEATLGRRGIICKTHVYDDMNPTEKEIIRSEISSFSPDLIMHITQTVKQMYNGVPSGGIFQLTMIPPGDSAYVWKANLETSTGGYGTGISSQAAQEIIWQLEKDGIIKPSISSK